MMKFPRLIYQVAVFFLLNSRTGISNAQTVNVCNEAANLVKTAEKFHYAPRKIDDEFSSLVFDEFLSSIDPGGVIFPAEDFEKLARFRTGLDEEILQRKCTFIDEVISLYKERLKRSLALLDQLKSKSIDLNSQDTLKIALHSHRATEADISRRWEKLIKYQLLLSYTGNADSLETLPFPPKEKINAMRDELIDRHRCRLTSRLEHEETLQKLVHENFLKAVSFAFDPHTEYFGAPEKEAYYGALSKASKGYGIEFAENESGELEIYYIVPGSPAWNSNALNEGDIITGLETISGKTHDFTCIREEEAFLLINDAKLNEVYFNIRKKNGRQERVKLFKDEIDVEENVIKSFLLEGERKIGYIYLPSFYTIELTDNYLPNGCANDLAKEIIKLKREGIEGLILDLRNNGGGSMLEALRTAGIFINYGALCIVTTRNGEPETLKDPDRGTVFDQPLLVLINKFSASASELFAAAMQDYHRALIVGSNSFGKSTAQEFIPSDAYRYSSKEAYQGEPASFVKLTEGAFFRVTGETHQREGVVPDIRLPDRYDRQEMGEGQYSTALTFPKIDKKTYYYPLPALPVDELRTLSENRVKSNEAFAEIEAARLAADEEVLIAIPLAYDQFIQFLGTLEDDEESESGKNDVFSLKNPSYIEGISDPGDAKTEINAGAMKEIKNDLYITESFQILSDLIRLKNN